MAIAQTSTSPKGCCDSSCMAPLLDAFSSVAEGELQRQPADQQVDDAVADQPGADRPVEPVAVVGLLAHPLGLVRSSLPCRKPSRFGRAEGPPPGGFSAACAVRRRCRSLLRSMAPRTPLTNAGESSVDRSRTRRPPRRRPPGRARRRPTGARRRRSAAPCGRPRASGSAPSPASTRRAARRSAPGARRPRAPGTRRTGCSAPRRPRSRWSSAATASSPRSSAAYRMSRARLRARERAGTGRSAQPVTRPRYEESRVSTLIFSPVVMKSGTLTVAPVSTVAGLVPPVERSPWRPGSV